MTCLLSSTSRIAKFFPLNSILIELTPFNAIYYREPFLSNVFLILYRESNNFLVIERLRNIFHEIMSLNNGVSYDLFLQTFKPFIDIQRTLVFN
jgi:hypothetical protein